MPSLFETLDEHKRCRIYDIRPQICRDFGDKPFSLCAYNGLESIPDDYEERKRLAMEAQVKSTACMIEMSGYGKVRVNAVDAGVRNVLSPNFKAIGKRGL